MAKNIDDFNLPNDAEAEIRLINELEKLHKEDDSAYKKKASTHELAYLLHLLEKSNERQKYSGTAKWFIPGTPFGIENLPRHRGFFEAGATNRERLFMAGNRCG